MRIWNEGIRAGQLSACMGGLFGTFCYAHRGSFAYLFALLGCQM
ncbi:hypothetical protein PAECIP111890_04468 [Paenibacillus sp. JJ-223]|nr:hypothetical protein PAECIP111890_04468 [Paenibacillus sp. JJ-223]